MLAHTVALLRNKATTTFIPGRGMALQRKCTCRTHTMGGGQCAECQKMQVSGQPLQTKLAISEPGDVYEQEADRVAEQVMTTPVHRTVSGMPSRIQRFSGQSNGQTKAAPASVDQALASPGRPLESSLRQDMEQRFSHDFSRVRVHSGATAEQSARDVNANAYTAGHNIVFGSAQFAPESHEGRRLIAHELTHVVQQGGAGRSTEGARETWLIGQNEKPDPVNSRDAVHLRAAIGVARQPAPPPSPITLPSEGVEMPWVGKGGTNSSELGYLRDPTFFWVRFRTVNSAALSSANNTLIDNGRSPIVDDDWIRAYPQHAAYRGQVLEHHHVGQGSKAVPIPSGLHDAYTVFHPQRRVVGTPARGTRPLPPQPTHADAQAEIDRHVAAGRIPRTAGGSSPTAPAIPPASAVAGVSTQRAAPTSAPAITPRAPAVTSPAAAPRAPRAWSGRQSSGTAGAAGAAIAGALIDLIGRILLQRYFKDRLNEHARAKIEAALKAFDLDAFLATHEQQIMQAQSEGWEVRIRIAIATDWQDTEIGGVLMKAEVAACQLLYENQTQPAPYSRPQGNFLKSAVRTYVGSTSDSQAVEVLLEGTDLQQRRYRKSRAEIDAMLNPNAGRAVEFESLLLQGQMGKIPLNELRDYTQHKRKLAAARGDTAAVEYWLSMETLAIGPVDNLIDQAKIKGLPLADLRKHAADTAAVAGESGDRASQHAHHVWSAAVRRIDAPLTDQQSADRQRYIWSQPATDADLGAYSSRIAALEQEIAELQQEIATLQLTDARIAAERAAGEPPHPPYAKIEWELKPKLARLKEDLQVERRMLRDEERKSRPTR